jgi:hypothetical protein
VENVTPYAFRHTVAKRLVRNPQVDLVTLSLKNSGGIFSRRSKVSQDWGLPVERAVFQVVGGQGYQVAQVDHAIASQIRNRIGQRRFVVHVREGDDIQGIDFAILVDVTSHQGDRRQGDVTGDIFAALGGQEAGRAGNEGVFSSRERDLEVAIGIERDGRPLLRQ